jgi:di/tricarboxylate transporter
MHWWIANRRSVAYGLAAGILWGFLTFGTATPRQWLVLDQGAGVVYQYAPDLPQPRTLLLADFYQVFYSDLIQGTLIFLVVAGLAGWATWQLSRLRPRGETQVKLRDGLDWYLIMLALGGLLSVVALRAMGAASWFKGAWNTPAGFVSIAMGLLLPLYAGVATFLVWFLRLPSIRAPDWETHYPKRFAGGWRSWLAPFSRRRKGGDNALDE